MTDLLQQAIDQLQALPPAEQDAYALALMAELEADQRFEAAMESPQDLILDELLAQAKADVAAGRVKDISEL